LEGKTVISFSATIGETHHTQLESQIIDSIKFEIANLKTWSRIDQNKKPLFDIFGCPTPEEGITFIAKNQAK
jgi:hypothetical protein